ncbi:ATP-binding cassette domain-containing protein [Periweissella cryptocerci]|uniref:ATP-binding cassette domain-containing protein n=1 Tax=Periweissella cryptocerci TaxID=2506420 RepID=A0A4P6YU45_9LACO|nr:cysteine peptidase family C39 domain-containing protein [Periweissella cryptocerci]QBO36288.1 ATP-binding cassette domain-containing protein [Periweissella cryptocerci]
MKVVLQNNNQDCLLACYSMILSFYGANVPIYQLYDQDLIPPDGLSVEFLKKLNTKYGLKMGAYKGGMDKIILVFRRLNAPFIIQWEDNHFVVVENIQKKCVSIVDPNYGRRKVSYGDFEKGYSGYVILLKNTSNFIKRQKINEFYPYLLNAFKGKNSIQYLISLGLIQLSTIGFSILIKQILSNQFPIISIIAMVLALCLGRFIGYLFERTAQINTNYKFEEKVTTKLFEGIFSRPLMYFRNNTPGAVLEKMNLRTSIRDSMLFNIIPAMINFLSVFVLFGYLILISPQLSLVALIVTFLYGVVNILIYKRRIASNSEYIQNLINLSETMQEDLVSIDQIKAQNFENKSVQRWKNSSWNTQVAYNGLLKIDSFANFFSQFFTFVNVTLLITFGMYLVSKNSLTIADLVLFQTGVTMFMGATSQVQAALFDLSNIDVYGNKLADMFEKVKAKSDSFITDSDTKSEVAIQVRNVSYDYPGTRDNILQNITFDINKGEKIAIVGASGAGKSTLLLILLGLLPVEGIVEYGDKNFRKNLGVVLQNMTMSKGTVLDNLIDNEITQESFDDVNAVLRDVNIFDAVNKLPKKLDSQLFQQGKNLSGGQVQRLLIARSLLNQSSLVFWDEAFSSLDNQNRKYLYEHVLRNDYYSNKTIVMISHHMDVTDFVDKIIYVNQRTHQVEVGTKEMLLQSSKDYRNFISNLEGSEKYA